MFPYQVPPLFEGHKMITVVRFTLFLYRQNCTQIYAWQSYVNNLYNSTRFKLFAKEIQLTNYKAT